MRAFFGSGANSCLSIALWGFAHFWQVRTLLTIIARKNARLPLFPKLARTSRHAQKRVVECVEWPKASRGENFEFSFLFPPLLFEVHSLVNMRGIPSKFRPSQKKPMEHAAHNPNFKTWIIAASVQFEQCQERNVKFAGIDSSGTARYDLKWSGYICKCSFAHSDNFVSTSTLSQVRLELHFLNSPRSRSSGGLWRPAPPRPRPGGPRPPFRRTRPLQKNFF